MPWGFFSKQDDETQFWELIERSRQDTKDCRDQIPKLEALLRQAGAKAQATNSASFV